jgi:hypothetical protein
MSAVFVDPKSLFSDSHPALSVISHPDPETDLNPACFQNFISHAKIMIHVAPRLNFTSYHIQNLYKEPVLRIRIRLDPYHFLY